MTNKQNKIKWIQVVSLLLIFNRSSATYEPVHQIMPFDLSQIESVTMSFLQTTL